MSLHDIQRKVRAKKSSRNDFGGYNYRNAEGILAELKASLPDGWTVIGSDKVVEVAGRLFLKHEVGIFDAEGKSISVAEGWAMHPDTKKGMDPAQITGACSTYAKKYALQNLLAIDDGSVDPDADKEPYAPAPELPADIEPTFNAVAVRDRLKAAYETARDLARVEQISADEKALIARLYAEDQPKFLEVKAAKDAAMARTQGEAA
jgi:hypothetical protein